MPSSMRYHCTEADAPTHYQKLCGSKTGGDYFPVQIANCEFTDSAGQKTYKYFNKNPTPNKQCAKEGGEPSSCYCCCACMAYGTSVGVPGGHRSIESIASGDYVLAGKLTQGNGSAALSWEPVLVGFSDGTAMEGSSHTVYLSYGPPEGLGGELICSLDQVVMLANGGLVRASQLHVGDELVDQSGRAVPLRSVAIGEYRGGVHHIGTVVPAGGVDGHLLVAGGVVVGDYYLQLTFDSVAGENKVHDAEQRPHIWSDEYRRQAGVQPTRTALVFGASTGPLPERVVLPTGTFTVFSDTRDYCDGAVAAFLTPAQSADIRKRGKQTSFENPIPKALVDIVLRHLRGFFPDVDFELDWVNPEPNVYSSYRDGRKRVVVTGGLARTRELDFEGLTMAAAHGVHRFSEGEQRGHSFRGAGAADYDAFVGTSRWIWWGKQWIKMVYEAQVQWEKLFGLITSENAGADPDNQIYRPAISCRVECIEALNKDLPECAGGPPPLRIALEEARATEEGVALVVNLAPTEETAAVTENYIIHPHVEVRFAERDPDRAHRILLTTAQSLGVGDHTVTIRNLISDLDTGVDPDRATVQVTGHDPAPRATL
ncbi:hypothetical protein [Streptomyces zagrosensis]|uniref:Uncharacterized protein n=1 Tax=Streptomyces zagrosensis TaxID=1042984 RepID=A0A7W9V2K3_9ACTN|nr:hypothetical protein [Streptomyces zagrosensis]MBB5940380.1 hypothetical protein [Streptomyces zagrosensis]